MKHHPASPDWHPTLFNSTCHGGLFGSPKPPPITPPAVMPTPDDAAVQAAKQRQLAATMARSGRQSTILTDNGNQSDKLG